MVITRKNFAILFTFCHALPVADHEFLCLSRKGFVALLFFLCESFGVHLQLKHQLLKNSNDCCVCECFQKTVRKQEME